MFWQSPTLQHWFGWVHTCSSSSFAWKKLEEGGLGDDTGDYRVEFTTSWMRWSVWLALSSRDFCLFEYCKWANKSRLQCADMLSTVWLRDQVHWTWNHFLHKAKSLFQSWSMIPLQMQPRSSELLPVMSSSGAILLSFLFKSSLTIGHSYSCAVMDQLRMCLIRTLNAQFVAVCIALSATWSRCFALSFKLCHKCIQKMDNFLVSAETNISGNFPMFSRKIWVVQAWLISLLMFPLGLFSGLSPSMQHAIEI